MGTSIFILLLVQIILIILNAIFASAEIAVLSMNETKLERMAEQGNGRAKRLVRLTKRTGKISCDHSGCNYIVGIFGERFCSR